MSAQADRPLVEIVAPRTYASKRAVVEAIGEVMVGAAAVTAGYVESMLQKEMSTGTLIAPEVALPHASADARSCVRRNILVVVPIRDGVEWLPGKVVRLAIGFAGTGDDAHLRLMGSVARVLSNGALIARLKAGEPAAAELFE